MTAVIRDPRYALPFAVLICVIAVSAVLARTTSSASPAGAAPVVAVTASSTPARPSTATATATAARPSAATATATPAGPSAADAALDARRRDDLASVAAALDAYRAKNGGYPSTNDEFGTLCAQAFDAGCLLTTVVKQLPASDGTNPYWYRSSGKTYTLFTRLQNAVEPNNCPAQVPPALASAPIYCLSGGSR